MPAGFRILFAALLIGHTAAGQIPAPSAPDPQVAARLLRDGDSNSEGWSAALRLLATPDARATVLAALKARPEFPKSALVARLNHPELAVRLAALEILEGAAGNDHGFNPWLPAADATNDEALKSWRDWAAGASNIAADITAPLTDENMRTYLRDIITGRSDRAERALRMLEPHGSAATARIERFLLDTPNLSDAARAHLRAAQFRIVLRPAAGSEAAAVAQRLAFGTRDQQITSLGQLRQFGLCSLPIAARFLDAPDPLVRESAMDTYLLLGGAAVFPVVKPLLEKELSPNVIHAAIRRFADIKAEGTDALLARWLGMDDENIVVECLETAAKRGGDRSGFSMPRSSGGGLLGMLFGGSRSSDSSKPVKSSELATAITKRLGDPEWRVRASAFKAAGKLPLAGIEDAVLKGMDDDDEFVQLAAMEAASAMALSGALPKMESLFLSSPHRMAVVASGMAGMEKTLTPAMHEALAKANPEDIVGVIAALRTKGETGTETFLRLSAHADPDVRLSALSALANGLGDGDNDQAKARVIRELSGDSPQNIRAIVENITLPRKSSDIPAEILARMEPDTVGPTPLDPLYDAFLRPLGQAIPPEISTPDAVAPPPAGSLESNMLAVAKGARPGLDADTTFRAAIALLRSGDTGVIPLLANGLAERPVSQRVAIASALGYAPEAAATPMLRVLLADPAETVRQEAVGAAMGDTDRARLAVLPVQLLGQPGSILEPWDIYGYSLESMLSDARTRNTIRVWVEDILGRPDTPVPLQVLALTIAPRAGIPATAIVEKLNHTSAHVRRAAIYSWLTVAPERGGRAMSFAKDPSPLVREAVAAALCPIDSRQWEIRFNDLRAVEEETDYNYREKARLPALLPDEEDLLRSMLGDDSSPLVKFQAAFTLLARSRTIDVPSFIRLVAAQDDQESSSRRVAGFLRSNYRKLGKPFANLLLYADAKLLEGDTLADMQSHFGINAVELSGFAASAPAPGDTPAAAFLDTAASDPAAASKPVTLVYFFSPGCAECAKVDRMLEKLVDGPYAVTIRKHNIKTSDGTLLNQALCLRLGLPAVSQGVSPAVFAANGALVASAITPVALDALAGRASTADVPDNWDSLSGEERAGADAALAGKYGALTLKLVFTGGLLDGVNPCAFATIIYFLSYLQVARRTPRQILAVGIAFIAAVFLTYFLAGLVLYQFLGWLDRLSGARAVLHWLFALFALGVAVFSLRDAWLARQGRLHDMTLQLPGFLKDRIRATIRGGAKQSRFVVAAFSAGIVISFLELACTGQVYAPIIYAVQQEAGHAVGWLLLYNLAFISPLVVIFLLAWRGMKSDALIAFQKKHTATVKLLIGLLFLALFALLAFGMGLGH